MSPKPFTENSQHEYDEAREVRALYHRPSANTIICSAAIIALVAAIALLWPSLAHARSGMEPKPVLRPVGLLQAKRQCARSTPRVECRAALRRALAAVAWQKREVRRVLEHTRGKQPFAYAAHLAELACHSFAADHSRCRPALEMLNVGRCESGLQRADPNPTSTALGWTQWLSGTWNAHPAGQQGWSRLDVLAMGIATEALVYHDHGWHEWSCGWAAT